MSRNKAAAPKALSFTSAELEALYTGHVQMAHHIANKLVRTYHGPAEDLHDEAESLLGLIIARWHTGGQGQAPYNGQASPRTWIYRILFWQLQTWIRKNGHPITRFSTLDTEEHDFEPAHKPTRIQALLRNLGEEAAFVLRCIVYAPIEIADDVKVGARAQARVAVQTYLRKTCGWTQDKIEACWKEVGACLQ